METPNQSLAYGVMGGRGDGDLCEGGSCKVKEQRKPLWWGSGMRGAGGGGGQGTKTPAGRVWHWLVGGLQKHREDQKPGEWGGGSLRDGSGLWSRDRGLGLIGRVQAMGRWQGGAEGPWARACVEEAPGSQRRVSAGAAFGKVWGLQVLGKESPEGKRLGLWGSRGLETRRTASGRQDKGAGSQARPEARSPGVFWKEGPGSGRESWGRLPKLGRGFSCGEEALRQDRVRGLEIWGRDGALREGPGRRGDPGVGGPRGWEQLA